MRNIALGVILGLILGFGIAVLRDLLDNTVKSLHHVGGLHDVPLLAALPMDAEVSKTPLISDLPSHAPRVEAFRVLRTNLQFVDVDSTSKVFVFTSSVPVEGKSATATNVAIALAQTNRKVLLIDGDLRRPTAARLLSLEGGVGLTTVLVGEVTVGEAIQVHVDSGLHLLAAGAIPPNPAELLQSRAMRRVLEEVRGSYDVVIVDAPPLLPVTDAALLAEQADGAVIVVRFGKTTADQLNIAVERLRAVDATLLGAIFNMVPRKGSASGYGYGYGYGYAPDVASAGKTSRGERRELRKVEQRRRDDDEDAASASDRGSRGVADSPALLERFEQVVPQDDEPENDGPRSAASTGGPNEPDDTSAARHAAPTAGAARLASTNEPDYGQRGRRRARRGGKG